MLTFEQKIMFLKDYLVDIKGNYADSFKTDILFYFDEFEDIENNKNNFDFLIQLNSKEEIHNFVDYLTSKIVLKYNEKEDQLSDFIFYTINSYS
ncbi:MAG: hypothetical protein ACOXZK_01455 [Bacteroidales bacterium]|jgi:hypothetical protein